MKFDITHLLEQWDYQPGQVMVRRFKGKDGKEKIQLRVDLGLLQMNAEGRPDGKRPLGHESIYDFFLHRLDQYMAEHDGQDEGFTLNADDCARLQLEVLQYHHRYICFIQLEDFDEAARDTERNLEVIDFVTEYAGNDELAWSLEQFRPQVLMLHTRALASRPLKKEKPDYDGAVQEIETGLQELREFYRESGRTEQEGQSPEIQSLQSWLSDIKSERPLTARERLQQDLERAIQIEDFEKAAEVRDALRNLKPSE